MYALATYGQIGLVCLAVGPPGSHPPLADGVMDVVLHRSLEIVRVVRVCDHPVAGNPRGIDESRPIAPVRDNSRVAMVRKDSVDVPALHLPQVLDLRGDLFGLGDERQRIFERIARQQNAIIGKVKDQAILRVDIDGSQFDLDVLDKVAGVGADGDIRKNQRIDRRRSPFRARFDCGLLRRQPLKGLVG